MHALVWAFAPSLFLDNNMGCIRVIRKLKHFNQTKERLQIAQHLYATIIITILTLFS